MACGWFAAMTKWAEAKIDTLIVTFSPVVQAYNSRVEKTTCYIYKKKYRKPRGFFYSIWLFSFEDVGRTSRCVRCPAVQSEQAGASSIKHWSWGKQMWMSSTGLQLSALTSAAINKPCMPSSGCFVVLVCLTLILSAKVVTFGSIGSVFACSFKDCNEFW